MKPPYSELRGTKTWSVVLRAIGALQRNRDIVLQTKKEYVVGFLVSRVERIVSKKVSGARPAPRSSKKRA